MKTYQGHHLITQKNVEFFKVSLSDMGLSLIYTTDTTALQKDEF